MTRVKTIETIFGILGTELDKLNDEDIVIPMTVRGFRKDGFDIEFYAETKEHSKIIYDIMSKIRIDNNIWFDSGFSGKFIEWNLDYSVE